MGKLYLNSKKGYAVLFLLCSIFAYSQENLVVYKFFGKPKLKLDSEIKSVKKGNIISNKHQLQLTAKDSLLLIDEQGKAYNLNSKGNYSYSQIKNFKVANANASFTKKYFSYVWGQFIKNKTAKSKVGVVFRNDKVVLLQPSDSVKLYTSEIKFSWTTNFEESYFHLKNIEENHISKFGVNGNFVTLFVDNTLLKRGVAYQWAISEKKFPNLDDLVFYNFTLLTPEEFKALKPEIEAFKADMQKLGFTPSEIKNLLCNDYKMCY